VLILLGVGVYLELVTTEPVSIDVVWRISREIVRGQSAGSMDPVPMPYDYQFRRKVHTSTVFT
jgi:hypothetical protein